MDFERQNQEDADMAEIAYLAWQAGLPMPELDEYALDELARIDEAAIKAYEKQHDPVARFRAVDGGNVDEAVKQDPPS